MECEICGGLLPDKHLRWIWGLSLLVLNSTTSRPVKASCAENLDENPIVPRDDLPVYIEMEPEYDVGIEGSAWSASDGRSPGHRAAESRCFCTWVHISPCFCQTHKFM